VPVALPSSTSVTVNDWFRARITDNTGFTLDVSNQLKSFDLTRGRTSQTQAAIDKATLSCVFDDTKGLFDPDNTSSALVGRLTVGPASPVTFRLDTYIADLNSYVPLFTGPLDSLDRTFTSGDYSETTAGFVDSTPELARHIIRAGVVLPAELPGARINRLLSTTSRSGFRWTTRALTSPLALDTGQKVLAAYTCDGNTSSWDIAVQAAAAEGGLLFFDAAGVLTFRGQIRRLARFPAWTFSDDPLSKMHYEAGLTFRLSTDDLIVDAAVTTADDSVTSVFGPGGASEEQPLGGSDLTEASQLAGRNSGASRARYLFGARSVARRNAPQVTVNAAPWVGRWTSTAGATPYQAVVKAAVDDLALLVRHPYQGSTISEYHWVEGFTMSASAPDGVWSSTLNLTRADPIPPLGYWQLGVSQLGRNTTLTW
jgi:hypothetical protein